MQSPFLSIAEAAAFFRVSETTIRNAQGDFARLAHVHVNAGRRGRHFVTRESADALAKDLLKRAKSVEEAVESALGNSRKKKTGLKVV